MNKLFMIKDLFDEITAFVQQVYFPDVCADRRPLRRLAAATAPA